MENPKSLRSMSPYLIGYTIALLLTLAAFALMTLRQGASTETISGLAQWIPGLSRLEGSLSKSQIMISIVGMAVLQILVHLHYFLHLNFKRANRPVLVTLLFSLLILLIMVAGSFWIIADLDRSMVH